MDRAYAIADAHYRAAPPAVKVLAYDFFKALDANQDNQVSLHEFLALMKHEGHTRLANPHFFSELDRDSNGTLDFWEVLTLYYIIKSGRPICECCGNLILDTFFSCVECFDSPEGSYSLCIYCYRFNISDHNHSGRQQFLDTFTLLENKRRGRRARQNEWTNPTMGPTQTTPVHNNVPQQPSWSPQPPNAVPANTMGKWKAALKALELGLSVGSISTTVCTIM